MRISAVLIDIDGVLTVSWRPLPGRGRRRSVFVTAAAIADYVALLEQETEATAR